MTRQLPSLSAKSIGEIVKLRSSSRSGEGQVRVRKVRVRQSPAQRTQTQRFGPEPYKKFGFHHPPPPPTTNFFLGFKGV